MFYCYCNREQLDILVMLDTKELWVLRVYLVVLDQPVLLVNLVKWVTLDLRDLLEVLDQLVIL